MLIQKDFFITNKTQAKIPSLSFFRIKKTVLKKDYELSLVFVGEKKMRALNKIYRNKDLSTDILSFPLSKTSGEIFINPKQIKLEAKKFDRNFSNFLGFLFIHGLLHLKGFKHGSRMEKEEREIRVKFGI